MQFPRFLPVGLSCLGLLAVLIPAQAGSIHVAPDGDDAWSGRRRRPNAARTDGPLATLRSALRRRRAGRAEEGAPTAVGIVLQQGTYRLREPLDILPSDSGTDGAPLVIEGDTPEAPAVISAGVTSASAPEVRPRESVWGRWS